MGRKPKDKDPKPAVSATQAPDLTYEEHMGWVEPPGEAIDQQIAETATPVITAGEANAQLNAHLNAEGAAHVGEEREKVPEPKLSVTQHVRWYIRSTPEPDTLDFLAIEDVADVLDVTYQTARNLLNAEGSDRLPHMRFGNNIRIPIGAFITWLNIHSQGIEWKW